MATERDGLPRGVLSRFGLPHTVRAGAKNRDDVLRLPAARCPLPMSLPARRRRITET
jgi:hypothetical protein